MINNKKPYILCAAMHFDDGKKHYNQPNKITTGFVVTGRRHMDILNAVDILGIDKTKFIEYRNMFYGFLTSHNMYVDRQQAMEMASAIGQVESTNRELISEDLY